MSNNNSIGFICSGIFETVKLEVNSTKDGISLEIRKLCGGMKLRAVHHGRGEVLYKSDLLNDFLSKYDLRNTEVY